MIKKNTNDNEINYGFYSKLLKQPFDSVAELKDAEAKYNTELKAKEDKAAAKKADAKKVEDAFKTLNQSRKDYKEKLTQLTAEYSNALTDLKAAFDIGKKDIQDTLAAAEDNYSKALKEFTDKYDTYHLSLKDGDFETTISGSNKIKQSNKETSDLLNIFDLLFNF